MKTWLGSKPGEKRLDVRFELQGTLHGNFYVINGNWSGNLRTDFGSESGLSILDERGQVHSPIYITEENDA